MGDASDMERAGAELSYSDSEIVAAHDVTAREVESWATEPEDLSTALLEWIVVEYTANPVEAAIVKAATEREAAEAGARFLWDEALERADSRDHPVEAPKRVFVAPWDGRVAYVTDFVATATRAELQCCGGGPNAEHVNGSGHWGGCPIGPQPGRS